MIFTRRLLKEINRVSGRGHLNDAEICSRYAGKAAHDIRYPFGLFYALKFSLSSAMIGALCLYMNCSHGNLASKLSGLSRKRRGDALEQVVLCLPASVRKLTMQ